MDNYVELQKYLFCTQIIIFNNLTFNITNQDRYILFNKKIIKKNNKYAYIDSGYINYVSFYLIYNKFYLNLWCSMEQLFNYYKLNHTFSYILNQKIYIKQIINKNNIAINTILINTKIINININNELSYFKNLIQLYINQYKKELINNNFYNFKKEKII